MAASAPETQDSTLRRRINQELSQRDLPNLDEEEQLEESEQEEIDAGIAENIFDHCHKLIDSKGEVVSYEVQKNSQFVAKKPHPYSWEKIQAEFGAGHYRVIARSERTKSYLKQQTMFVEEAPVREDRQTVAEAVRAALPIQTDKFEEMSKTIALLKSLTPAPVTPPKDETPTMMMEFMKTVMSINDKSQENSMRMMEKIQESTSKLIEKMDTSNKEMFNRLEAKIGAAGEKKEKSFDAMTLLSMLQKAEERGMNSWMKIEELAEKKAARMSGGKEDEEPESATEKLVKQVLPAITAAMSARQAPPPQRPQPPRQIRQAAPGVRPPSPTVQPQPGPVTPQVMPKLSKQEVVDQISAGIFQRLIEADAVKADREAVIRTQKQAAVDVKATVTRLGITLPGLLQMIPQGDMIDIATTSGLPLEAHRWLEGFYAYLKELAAQPVRPGLHPGRPAGGPQPQPAKIEPAKPVQPTGSQSDSGPTPQASANPVGA